MASGRSSRPSWEDAGTTSSTQTADHSAIARLAAEHDLDVDPASLQVNEIGLDFRVAIARAAGGERWVLRIPRRPDVLARADIEGRLLSLIGPQLTVAVPDWQIHSHELIAYPLLPGEPALTLDDDGSPQWHVDMSSTTYSATLGEFIAQLHSIDAEQARSPRIVHVRSEEHTSELQSRGHLVCRLLLEKKS